MKHKLKLMLLVLATTGLSADIAIEPFAATYHWDRDKEWNEGSNHQYIGVSYIFDSVKTNTGNFEVGAATYINSHDERTKALYVGYRQPLYKEGNVDLGIFADIGYRDGYGEDSNILIYGGAYARYYDFYLKLAGNSEMVGVNVGYIFTRF